MILPIGDAPNPRNFTPWVTWLLIAANVAVYLLLTLPQGLTPATPGDPRLGEYVQFLRTAVPPEQLSLALSRTSAWDLTVFTFGYRPADPSLLDLFASLFMHAGIAHLAGNMLFLYIYGDNVEARLGRLAYLLAYLGAGVAASLSFAWLAGPSQTPLVGASGAISGVLGLYFVAYPRNVVRMLVGLPPFFFTVVLLPAWLVLGAYVLFSNLLPLLSGAESSVAYGAHLGGFAAGVGLAVPIVWGGLLMGARPSASAPEGVLGQARSLEKEGRVQGALQILVRARQSAVGADRAELELEIGSLLARHGLRAQAYQWLYRAAQHRRTAPEAQRVMAEMGLDPRLLARVSPR